jgi:uncharacterized protein
MAAVKFDLNENNSGAFTINDDGKQIGEMVVDIKESKLTVYHTEVAPEAEGKGCAKDLLDAMVDYARKNNLQVVPFCPFVTAQFRRHPEEYADVWKKGEQ